MTMTREEIICALKNMTAADLTKIEAEVPEIRKKAVEKGFDAVAAHLKQAKKGAKVDESEAARLSGMSRLQVRHPENYYRAAESGLNRDWETKIKKYVNVDDPADVIIKKKSVAVFSLYQ